jgi:D-tyrosyl-tRNA(Tyr) deacylase
MRAVVQRVAWARVRVDGEIVGAIPDGKPGLVALIGCEQGDDFAAARYVVERIVGLRVFADAAGKMNLALGDVGGGLLLVSQFTLLGDCRKGRRPSFVDAMAGPEADALFGRLVEHARTLTPHVATGRFQTHMEVELLNDGPVTLLIDSARRF